ncbi:helix-turn-helix transcriptional regulator [Dyella sp.]|uniref:helix-turn-helix transcriptional regulator n=1 Tax=Dyella sp. TaxID=1869338 RepID=UPI00283E26D4|nr:helix-turn-helix transcriptional regulator [Dyella sp.]MDR3445438.1 helix-turn-helix transcriptional regulator [Dyella sp.]
MRKTSVHQPHQVVLVELLREFRLKAGLTQAQVAKEIGVAQTTISDIEINERGLKVFLVRDLCKLYGHPSFDKVLAEVDKRVKKGIVASPARIVRKDRKQQ